MEQIKEIKTEEELRFAIFCIENMAEELNYDPVTVYRAFRNSNIINGYIIPFYDVLHTQGKEYIINDIKEYMQICIRTQAVIKRCLSFEGSEVYEG